jgi:hypothetical protein
MLKWKHDPHPGSLSTLISPPSIHQALRNREPESGPAVFTAGRAVCLRERLEEKSRLLRRDPDAAVLHRKAKPVSVGVGGRRRFAPNLDAHFASGSEFDGVADKVHENLTQPIGIALHALWYLVMNLAIQLEAFAMRGFGQQLGDFLHHLVQIEIDVFRSSLCRRASNSARNPFRVRCRRS